ncbi:MAG: exodeoxyribonuclease V subunit gamma [Gammaproteobacteria bacterium]|nr:exodeoxyribonuclease V subunit gamma [Gammaproteobacteria bacterium]
MLKVSYSNRLESLLPALIERCTQVTETPLAPEVIVIPNHALARWLSLKVAQKTGVSANFQFQFPAEFLWRHFHQVLDDVPEASVFRTEVLSWRLYELFPQLANEEAYPALCHYLAQSDERQQFALAERLAATYDQYLIYRPDWITDWDTGKQPHWQARLWHQLSAGIDERHWVDLQNLYLEKLPSIPKARLPERVSLFSVADLSPAFLALFSALGERTDVTLFWVNPSQHYWGDILSEKQIARRISQGQATTYLESGNSLLASWGTQGRELFESLQDHDIVFTEYFDAPPNQHLLGHLQHNILDLKNSSNVADRFRLEPSDKSLQVHVCHSPFRELEVLHDQLLDCLQRDHNLTPGQIAVVTPDLTRYAPYIDAVFGTVSRAQHIPYHIAGLRQVQLPALISGYFALLEAAESRFENERVLSLLENPAIRRRFDIEDHHLPVIHNWIRDVQIRWGLDDNSRLEHDLPAGGPTHWQAGLDRLLLGYAMYSDGFQDYKNILPHASVKGSQAQLLGSLAAFIQGLGELSTTLSTDKSVPEWREILNWALDHFFLIDEEDQRWEQGIRQALQSLTDNAKRGGFTGSLPAHIPIGLIKRALEEVDSGSGFHADSVMFSTLAPIRNIPFKVLCLIGMDDGAFPRMDRRPGFDLMANHRRRGDRSQRNEDRYLFLEALLAARQCFYISYIGQGIRENTHQPPSVMVSELLDYINLNCQTAVSGDLPAESLTTWHLLQGFDPRYFKQDSNLFSYASDYLQASRQLQETDKKDGRFFDQPLSRPEYRATVPLETFIRAFTNPASHLLQECLGIYLARPHERPDPREPFHLSRFEEEALAFKLMALHQSGVDAVASRRLVRASGTLPEGIIGDRLFTKQAAVVKKLLHHLESIQLGAEPESITIDVDLGPFRLNGLLKVWDGCVQADYLPSKSNARSRLMTWIKHLVIQAQSQGVGESFLFRTDEQYRLRPVEKPMDHLRSLAGLYDVMSQQPVHFFPKSSMAFAEQLQKKGDEAAALDKARKNWWGGQYNKPFPESQNPYYQLLFGKVDPLDDAFMETAEQLIMPLLDHSEKLA